MSAKANPDLIIYDCDGTLVDTSIPLNMAFLDTLHKHGYVQFDFHYLEQECFGYSLPQLLEKMGQDAGRKIEEDVILEYQKQVPRYLKRFVQPDKAQIEQISKLGSIFRQCVASNGLIGNVRASLKQAGLSKSFPDSNIFVSAQVPRPKPFPDLFIHVATKMNSKRPIVIEDSVLGIEAARAANMLVIGYTGLTKNPARAGEILHEAGADYVAGTWQEIRQILHPG